jgi:hypothetical protein
MTSRRTLLVGIALIALPRGAAAQTSGRDPAQVMRDLRQQFLATPAASYGFAPSREYPRVFGVAMDWPLGEHIATVVSALDGSASLYTTSTFGVIGGAGHEPVRAAARRFVTMAEGHHDEASPTSTYPYPGPGKVRFYLRTFADVRMIESDASAVYSASGRYSTLFRGGQAVLTELRKVTEQQKR